MNGTKALVGSILVLALLPACRKMHTYTCSCLDARGNMLEQFKVEAENTGAASEPCLKQQEKWNKAGPLYIGTSCSVK